MEVFEKKYTDDIELEDAILLGLDALHSTTEGVFNASTIEVGVIELSTRNSESFTLPKWENMSARS